MPDGDIIDAKRCARKRGELIAFLYNYKEVLHKEYNIQKIILFGSYAQGTNTQKSDIDIAIEMPEASYSILFQIKEDLERKLRKNVDIVRLRKRMNRFLLSHIQNEGIVV